MTGPGRAAVPLLFLNVRQHLVDSEGCIPMLGRIESSDRHAVSIKRVLKCALADKRGGITSKHRTGDVDLCEAQTSRHIIAELLQPLHP